MSDNHKPGNRGVASFERLELARRIQEENALLEEMGVDPSCKLRFAPPWVDEDDATEPRERETWPDANERIGKQMAQESHGKKIPRRASLSAKRVKRVADDKAEAA